MARNIVDLAEHAVDPVPDRVAVACGDGHVTYPALTVSVLTAGEQ